jgi:hypothetical protein
MFTSWLFIFHIQLSVHNILLCLFGYDNTVEGYFCRDIRGKAAKTPPTRLILQPKQRDDMLIDFADA